jgi:hypothetical protein
MRHSELQFRIFTMYGTTATINKLMRDWDWTVREKQTVWRCSQSSHSHALVIVLIVG